MTTTNLHMPRAPRLRAWLAQRDPIALLSIAVCLLILIGAMLRQFAGGIGAPAIAAPTPALDPIIIIATALPVAPPAPAQAISYQQPAAGIVLTKAIVVYGAPDSATAIGAVEAGRAYALLARYGADWLQLDVSGSGAVYARTSDVLGIPADLADLQPAPQPQVVYVSAPAPESAPAPVEEQQAPALAAPTPEQPAYNVASERQRNIQQRLANDNVVMPYADTSEQRAQNRVQSCAEHPEWHC